MDKKLIKNISQKVIDIINHEVSNQTNNGWLWKDRYESAMRELETEIEDTRNIIKDYTEQNLTFNKIENEGYLRGLITMTNLFKHLYKEK